MPWNYKINVLPLSLLSLRHSPRYSSCLFLQTETVSVLVLTGIYKKYCMFDYIDEWAIYMFVIIVAWHRYALKLKTDHVMTICLARTVYYKMSYVHNLNWAVYSRDDGIVLCMDIDTGKTFLYNIH